jgi:alpha-tubulin suppressor-like RCC1 family protein
VLVSNASGTGLQGKLVKALVVGSTQALVQCTDGSLAAWGIFGGDGQDASTRNYSPVPVNMSGVLSGKTVGAIYSRTNHHTLLCTDGTAVAWGEGSEGSMGDGSNTARVLPVLVNTSALAPDDRIVSLSSGPLSFNNFAIVGFSGLPDIALTPFGGSSLTSGVSTLAFGTEELTFTKPISVTLQNTGSGPLEVSGIALSGTNAADFSIFPALPPSGTLNLAPGAKINFVVSFTPSSAAAHSATLTVTSTDFDESPFTVALTGAGQALDTTPLAASYTTGAEVPVTAATYTAAGRAINLTFNYQPAVGSKLVVINNTGLGFIRGAFTNLRQGQPVTISYNGQDYHFVANYYGGTGNDLELVWATNRLAAWGYGGNHLGVNPPTDANTNTPRAVGQTGGLLDGKAILSVTSGYWHSVALMADGTLLSWGNDYSGGRLGNGTTDPKPYPAPVDQSGVLAGKRVVAISAGNSHTLALTADGLVAAWGANGSGQLGDGTTTPRYTPVLVNTLGALAGKFVVGISAGYTHSLALCSDGTLIAWGEGTSGQMGNGTANSSSVPVTVTVTGTALEGRTPIQVSAGSSHCMALCSDGTAVSWGSNSYGQLGISPSANPVYVARAVFTGAGSALQGKTLKSISSGSAEVTGLCTDGTLVAWGLFTGDGTNTTRDIPVLVSTATALSGKTAVAHS